MILVSLPLSRALSPPTRLAWSELRERFITSVENQFTRWISPSQAHFKSQLDFAAGRLDESTRATTLPVQSIVGDGAELPYGDRSFDLVLLFDVFEHLKRPSNVARQVMRVLRPGGVCMISTPARLRYIFRPDPHYGIRGLLLLPNGVQRFLVNRVFRRRVVGHDCSTHGAYDVEHTYWHVGEIAKLFPKPKTVDVLYKRVVNPPGRIRFFQFEHLLIYKGGQPAGTPIHDLFETASV